MKIINIEDMHFNPFTKLGKEWCLIGAKDENGFNALTASWGGLGVLWNKNVATIYIRPQRYTKTKIDASDTFTIMFFDDSYRKELQYYGSHSGKDENKEEACNFHVEEDGAYSYIKEAKLVLECKKLYRDSIKAECMLDTTIDTMNYPQHDYHDMYIAEIVKVMEEA